MKDHVDYHVSWVLVDKTRRKRAKGVLKEPYLTVSERLKLRRILFRTDDGKE